MEEPRQEYASPVAETENWINDFGVLLFIIIIVSPLLYILRTDVKRIAEKSKTFVVEEYKKITAPEHTNDFGFVATTTAWVNIYTSGTAYQ